MALILGSWGKAGRGEGQEGSTGQAMPIWPFRLSRADQDAAALLDSVVAASRRPALYGAGRAPDTLEGRFELMALHAALALIRLRAEPGAEPLAQRFTDRLFRHFDAGLREAGVGDLTVPKRMRALAGQFYGRVQAYAEALEAQDRGALAAAAGRNILGAEDAPFAGDLAAYAEAARARQAEAPLPRLWVAEAWTFG